MQKHVNLVDLVKSFPTNIYLQSLASIQKRTSPVKFAHLAEKSGIAVRYRTFQLRLHLMTPHVVAIAAKAATPAIAGGLRARGVSMAGSRRLACAAGFAGTSVSLLALPLLLGVHPGFTTAGFSLALAATAMHAEGFRLRRI